ncbi:MULTISPECIES: hypothetical protein [unclassified Bradyrhizobium]|uniref:hypothetical protein n=1 Tax=unclassified Bradyrhizobium TaxID=2631580 RepID=UPI001FF8ED59|nr:MULTISPECIES: hypothetical protein [unclassified Bradyrhizobium]MCK1345858.1 hypothetical protein [Bradyrhizobium sp. CW11]MCK1700990.1 hypothetical protein [Bradyrhizobium sp. 146]
MTKASEKKTAPTPAGDDFVRMYPCNHLNEQLRDPKDAFSAFKVVKDAFFDGK